jgi:adenine/guanine/hypoxanthine permease
MERFFALAERGTNVRTEVLAGATTFLTMAYIVIVNPSIMAAAGIDQGAAFVATCLAAAIGSALMGLWANLPIALAPGMGLNAYFAFTVVQGAGVPWPVALGAVFLAGLVFLAVSLARVRERLVNGIPLSLKLGIAAGIGFFLGLIGLKTMGLVVAHPATLVGLGRPSDPVVLLGCAGFLLIAGLSARGVHGAIVIGVLATAAAGIPFGLTEFRGVVLMVLHDLPTGAMRHLDRVLGALLDRGARFTAEPPEACVPIRAGRAMPGLDVYVSEDPAP